MEIRDYILYQKALKDVADEFAFDDIRLTRQKMVFLATAYYVYKDREDADHPMPHFTTMDVINVMKYMRMGYKQESIYNYFGRCEKEGLLEKIVPKTGIGKISKYTLTHIGEYVVNRAQKRYEQLQGETFEKPLHLGS